MEEILKALAPWPVMQGIVIGLLVAAGGAWAMRRGLQDSRKSETTPPAGAQKVHVELTDEEKRLQWIAYEQLGNIEKNSFAAVRLLERIAEATNRLADSGWNARQ